MENVFYIGEDYKIVIKIKRHPLYGLFYSARTVKKGQPIYLENKSILLLMITLNQILTY